MAENETEWQKIKEIAREFLVKGFLGIILIIVVYILFRFIFELSVEMIPKFVNSKEDVNCPKKVSCYGIVKTNSKSGIIKYKFVNSINNNEELTGEFELKVTNMDSLYFTDTVRLEINSTSKIVIKYEINYSDFLATVLPDAIKENTINKKMSSASIKINCVDEPEEMKFVEGGSYEDINNDKNYKVESFYIDKYEVSYWSYYQFAKKKNWIVPYTEYYSGADLDNDYRELYPILGVTWDESKCYCESLGKRLLSIREWEYAANGGDHSNDENALIVCNTECEICNFTALKENSIGVYGLTCNAVEWCSDYLPTNSRLKAIKGFGSFKNSFNIFETQFINPDSNIAIIGFRCAKSLKND